MIDTRMRDFFQPTFNALSGPLVKAGISANTLTGLAFASGLCAGGLIAFGQVAAGVSVLWFSGLLDVLDGSVARLSGKSSKAGAYMDLILDRMVEAAIILGFAWRFPEPVFAYLLFFTTVIFNFSTFIVAGSLFANTGKKSIHYDVGLAERTETFLAFTAMAVWPEEIFAILMVFNLVILYTGIRRFIKVIRFLNAEQAPK